MLRNKRISMLLSLVIAFLLWSYVISEVNPTTTQRYRNVPVRILNEYVLNERGYALADDASYSIDLTLSGNRSDFLRVSQDEILLSADIRDCVNGENSVAISMSIPNNLTVSWISSRTVNVKVEDKISKDASVSIRYEGNLAEGMEPSVSRISPLWVEIDGARSKVNSVASVVASLDYSSLSEDGSTINVELEALDSSGEKVDRVSLEPSTVSISAQLLSKKTVNLEVPVVGAAELRNIYIESVELPSAVTIKGTAAALEDLESLTANPVDVSGLTGSADIDIDITLPAGIYIADESKSSLTAHISMKAVTGRSISIPAEDVEIIGELPEGYGAKIISTDAFEMIADGDEESLASLEADSFALRVYLEGSELGTQELLVEYELLQSESNEEETVNPEELGEEEDNENGGEAKELTLQLRPERASVEIYELGAEEE